MPMKTLLLVTALIILVCSNTSQMIAQSVHWKKMKEPITQTPNDIQRIGKYLVMTTMQSSFLVSEDNGKSWNERFNLKESSILPKNTIGSSLCSDSTANIVVSDGGFYLTRLISSTNLGISWSPLHSTVFHRMTIRSFCKWDSGFVVCGNNDGSDDSHIVRVIDTFSKRRQTITKHFFTVFALDKILAVGDSGIYESRKDSVDFKRIIDFSPIGDTITFNYESGVVCVTSGKYIYTSDDQGNSWRKDSVPFIIKHFKKSKRHLYAIDAKQRLWKADINERRWGVFLYSISNRRDVTCMYVDDNLMIFGIKYECIKRYSLEFDKWINEDIQIPLVTPYNVRVKNLGVYAFPAYGSSTLYSGYCRTTDSGESWKVCHIAPYGMMYARISDNTKYYQGGFHDFDFGYNMCFAFHENFGIGNVFPMVLHERDSVCIYNFVLNDKLMRFSRDLDSITIIKDYVVISKHKTNFPYREIVDQRGYSKIDVHQIDDSIICKNISNDSNCYYSIDYGEKWSPYRYWRSEYGKGVEIIRFGKKYLSVERNGLIKVFNNHVQSWITIHDSSSALTNIYDFDYNDFMFVMCNKGGLYYITQDDLSEITSVEETHHDPIDFTIKSDVFSNFISIDLGDIRTHYSIRVISLIGQEVVKLDNVTNRTFEVDCTNLSKGMYFVEVTAVDKRCLKKVLKM